MTIGMIISETFCPLQSECVTQYEVMDYDVRCPAIYWKGSTDFRGILSEQTTWRNADGSGGILAPVVSSEAPADLIAFLQDRGYLAQPREWQSQLQPSHTEGK